MLRGPVAKLTTVEGAETTQTRHIRVLGKLFETNNTYAIVSGSIQAITEVAYIQHLSAYSPRAAYRRDICQLG
jgi:hypothetical protein